MSLHTLPQPAGYRALPSGLLTLDSRSDSLIVTGKYEMPLPTTDAELVAQGWPSILGAVDGELWLCDEAAGNLVGEINGYQLAPQNAPLQNRDFHGLPYGGTLWGKKAVENTAVNQRWEDAVAADCDVTVEDFTLSLLVRFPAFASGVGYYALAKRECNVGSPGYALFFSAAMTPQMVLQDATGFTTHNGPAMVADGALHLVTVSNDRDGNVSFYVDDFATVNVAAARPGTLSSVNQICLAGNNQGVFCWLGQHAWAMINIGVAASRVGHDALWAALSSNHLGTANTYTRANPLTYGISASRVATAAANAFMPSYAPNASAGDNALRTSVVCDDAITFEPIGSTNLAVWPDVNNVHTSVDGPSGMRDAIRTVQAGAWDAVGSNCTYSPAVPGCAIAGASNIPWWASGWYKRATVGTAARVSLYFTGDGGGSEGIVVLTDNATPADWTQWGAAATPVRAGQTALYYVVGGAALNDDCDFGEPAVIKNRATAPLAWRRVATGAAAATGAQTLSYTNVGNARYSPARGRLRVRVSELAEKQKVSVNTYATGVNPFECCFDGERIWIVNNADNDVRRLVAATGASAGADVAVGVAPERICYDPGTGCVWVTNYTANTITKITAATGAVVGTYAAGAGGNPIGCCSDGTNIWVVNANGANTVTKILAATGATIGAYAVGAAPHSVIFDGTNVWISNYGANTVTKLLAATGGLVGTYGTAANPSMMCFDGTNIWICCYGATTLRKLLAATGAFVGDYTTLVNPFGCYYDGTYVWVACLGSAMVQKFRATTGAFVEQFSTGATPLYICGDGGLGDVWITENGPDLVRKLGARQVFLAFGAEAAQGALWLDYAGDASFVPLYGTAPQLRLRLWDDAAALVCDLDCGTLTTAEAIRTLEWDAIIGKVGVFNGATLLASDAGVWTPEPNDVTPLYVGSNAGADAVRCMIELLELWNY